MLNPPISFASHNKKPAEQYTESQKQEIVGYFHEHEAFMTKKEVCEKFATQWGVDAIRSRVEHFAFFGR